MLYIIRLLFACLLVGAEYQSNKKKKSRLNMIQLQEKKQEKEQMTTWLLREHRKAEEKK